MKRLRERKGNLMFMRARQSGDGEENGGTAALAKLYDAQGARIYRFLFSMSGDAESAREMTQEVFLKLAAMLRGGGKAPGMAYIFRAARNTAFSRLRRLRVERRVIDAESSRGDLPAVGSMTGDPARELERRELRHGLRASLAELPEGQRAVFLLSEIEGLSYEEIAGMLEIPPGTVASRKHKAVRSLRRRLEGRGHDL